MHKHAAQYITNKTGVQPLLPKFHNKNQSKIYCKGFRKIRMPLFIHIVSYVVKIYICHLAKVLKGRYTDTVRHVNILEIIGTTQNFVIT